MLGYVALIFIIYLSIKLSFKLKGHKQVFLKYEVSSARLTFLQLSSLLYIVSLFGFALPFPWLDLLRPIPTGFLLLIPGIILGKKISGTMDRVGFDVAVKAGRVANNIMWLGVGTAIFMAGNILIRLLMGNDMLV
ncbi:MAG TPA: hypothetical protein ENK04_13540 [Gammaproteobacteria bacterium]|nr:hypothetical protein [Gammaproteobacteria bacterium]